MKQAQIRFRGFIHFRFSILNRIVVGEALLIILVSAMASMFQYPQSDRSG